MEGLVDVSSINATAELRHVQEQFAVFRIRDALENVRGLRRMGHEARCMIDSPRPISWDFRGGLA